MFRLRGIILASAVFCVGAGASDAGRALRVRVRLYSAAAVPPRVIDYATEECTRIFKDAGIVIEWATAGDSQVDDLNLSIADNAIRGAHADAVGYVVRTSVGASAVVVWSRVIRLTAYHRPAFEIMGRVMAHEIGHLLLADGSHSAVGVMRARWFLNDLNATSAQHFFFTREEQSQMRRQILSRNFKTSPSLLSLWNTPQ
jgi:hypothetical protein